MKIPDTVKGSVALHPVPRDNPGVDLNLHAGLVRIDRLDVREGAQTTNIEVNMRSTSVEEQWDWLPNL